MSSASFPEPSSVRASSPVDDLKSAVRRPVASVRDLVHMGRAATIGQGLNWLTLVAMIVFHLGAVAALFCFSWQRLLAMVVLYALAINVGIGMCYHRLLTHRGYAVPRFIEYTMTVLATLALEGGPIFWVATHRVHHQLSDQPGDPHTPHDGSWWAHMGWILFGHALHAQSDGLAHYAPDLGKDRFHSWISRYHWLPLLLSGLLLAALGEALGGWTNALGMVLWGVFLRVTLGLHATWLVNSVGHIWGSRRFATRDDSRNNLLVALVTGGEGWHNNHHAHPVSARHGFVWYELDVNYWGIWLLARLGLARRVQTARWNPADPRPAGA